MHLFRPAILIGLLSMLGLIRPSQGSEPLRIAVGDYPPYLSESLPDQGTAARLIREAFALQGIDVVFIFLPWARAYNETQNGHFDATGIWLKRPERESAFWFSDALIKEKHVFFYLKDRPFEWKTVADLHGLTLGGIRGYSYGPILDQAIKAGQTSMERGNSDAQNFRKLLSGRIDLYPQEIEVGYATLRETFSAEESARLTHTSSPFLETDNHLLLPKSRTQSERLLADFNAGLKQLKQSGRYRQLIGTPTPP